MTPDNLIFQANVFLTQLFNKMETNNIVLFENWHIDHLCFRVSSHEQYERYKKVFLNFGKLLHENEVNGRLISTFKLGKKIIFKNYQIDIIELPDVKLGKQTIEGFEHAEVVCDIGFDEIKQIYSNCVFDESGLKKELNKELEIKLGEYSLKFHHMSLEEVIALEKQSQFLPQI